MFTEFICALWLKNMLPTSTSYILRIYILGFPCLIHCYCFININAGYMKMPTLVSIISKWFWISVLFHFSLLVVETADRPGLLVDLVKIISDININVQSGEFDTEVTTVLQSVCSCKEPYSSPYILYSCRGYWLKQNSMSATGANHWLRLYNR